MFDVVLLDIVMPGFDGWQVLEVLKNDPMYGNPAIFLVSAQDPSAMQDAVTPVIVNMGNGLSIKSLVRCSLEVSKILLLPEKERDPEPPQTHVLELA